MLQYLAKLFRRNSEPRPNQAPSAPLANYKSGDAGYEECASKRREALERFIRLATAHLGDAESRRLVDVTLASFDVRDDSSEAIEQVALGDGGQKSSQWFVIQCDWKASEEVEWQVCEVASHFGILEQWSWSNGDEASRTVPDDLCDAADWVAQRGLEMLHLNLGSDTYFAILVKHDDVENACQNAFSAGLKVLRTPEFKRSHA